MICLYVLLFIDYYYRINSCHFPIGPFLGLPVLYTIVERAARLCALTWIPSCLSMVPALDTMRDKTWNYLQCMPDLFGMDSYDIG